MARSTFRERLEAGETTVGTFQLMDSPMVSEIIGLAGLDFVILDQEHGPLTAETAVTMCMAAERGGAAPIVRVRSNAAAEIQRALDIGAAGVEIPQIETREDAAVAVDAARFQPLGNRGLNPHVRASGYRGDGAYTATQNEEVTVIVHIEGERGVDNLDEIMAVDGIDVLFLGPYDMSQSIGLPGEIHDERVESMMEDVCERAARADATVGTYAEEPAMARRWIDVGARYVAVYEDAPTLLDAFVTTRKSILDDHPVASQE